jgi:Elongation complex protein 6
MALLVSACGFTEPRKFIVIKEKHDIEGSFLINSLIGQRLRQQNAGIILVCCHQKFKYYDSCGKKLGYNLSMSVSRKVLQVIEPLKDMTNIKSDVLMDRVFNEIFEKLSSFESDGKKSVTVIVDDLSFFTNLGCSESDLIRTGIRLHELTQQKNGLSVVLKVGLSDLNHHLSNNIEDFADVTLTVEKLKSGDFWDVDGKLTIKKTNHQGDIPMVENERSLLYFIADHNVKLTVPGEFGLKM